MVYTRVFNSTYAKYKRAAGPRVNFAVPTVRRASFAGLPSMQDLMVAGGGIVDAGKSAVQGLGNAASQLPGLADNLGGRVMGAGYDAADAIGGAARGVGDMLSNGQFDPAEMAAAGLAGAGALGAGAMGLARRGGSAAAELPQGLRAKVGNALGGMSNVQKAGLGAAGAGALGAGALGANAMMRDEDELM